MGLHSIFSAIRLGLGFGLVAANPSKKSYGPDCNGLTTSTFGPSEIGLLSPVAWQEAQRRSDRRFSSLLPSPGVESPPATEHTLLISDEDSACLEGIRLVLEPSLGWAGVERRSNRKLNWLRLLVVRNLLLVSRDPFFGCD